MAASTGMGYLHILCMVERWLACLGEGEACFQAPWLRYMMAHKLDTISARDENENPLHISQICHRKIALHLLNLRSGQHGLVKLCGIAVI